MDIDRMLRDLGPGSEISAVVLLQDKTLAVSKAGKKYLTFTFADRTGRIEGKLWDEAEMVDQQLVKMNPVKVEGVLSVFRDTPQVTVRGIEPRSWTDDMYDLLLPVSTQSAKALKKRLDALLDSFTNPHIQSLAKGLAGDKALYKRFLSVPAAKFIHHAYIRGLLEHTVSMMEMASMLHQHYDMQYPGCLDRDVLLVGTLLHDMGKVTEYTFEKGIDLTVEGRLVGHLVLGIELLNAKLADLPDFPLELAQRIKHLLVSHHGDFEKGAPVRPITTEAQLLHLIDMMDSQFNAMLTMVNRAPEDQFSPYSSKFGRRFLNPYFKGSDSQDSEPKSVETKPAAPPAAPEEPKRSRKQTEPPPPPQEEMPEWIERDDPGGEAWEEPLPEGGTETNRSTPGSDSGEERRDRKKKKAPSSPKLF